MDVDGLETGKEKGGVQVVLEPATAWIEGTVVDPSGKPVAEASVHAYGDVVWAGSAETDAAGRFRLAKVKSHVPVSLRASASWHLDATAEKTILNSRGLRLVLKPAPRLRVKVVGPDGKPVGGVGFRVEADDEDDSWDAPDFGDQPKEGYEVALPLGTVRVTVYAEEREPVTLGPFDLEPGKAVDGGTVTLAPKQP
jgi:hypothetical protein